MEYLDVSNKKIHKKKKLRGLYDIFVNFNVQKIKFSKFQKVSQLIEQNFNVKTKSMTTKWEK